MTYREICDFIKADSNYEFNNDYLNISFSNYSFINISLDNFENESEKDFFLFPNLDEAQNQNPPKLLFEKISNIADQEKKTSTETKMPRFEIKPMKPMKPLGRKRIKENGNVINNIQDNNIDESIDDSNSNGENTHDKFSDDNLMRKIKSNITNYILTELNNSLRYKKYKFLKWHKDLTENLNKDFNIELLDRSIMDIISNTPIAKKYKKIDKDSNKKLVQKILEENRESKTIAIFNKKYIDIINEIRFDENNVYFFLKKIKEKEKNVKQNNNIDIEKYIKLIKDLLYNYEKYFYDKVGRQNNTKKNKSKINIE